MKSKTLAERMKRYEKVSSPSLTRRSPVIVRVDGRHFHTLTKNCAKPFDQLLINSMVEAAAYLAEDIQGFKLAYIQSDEASFVFSDYDDIKSDGWFDYDLSKIISITAARMSVAFSRQFGVMAEFDSRAFTVPREEITNYFLWRAKDWQRNSIQMLAQNYFSQSELHRKKMSELHEMLYTKGVNWSKLPNQLKNGTWLIGDEFRYDVLPNYESINNIILNTFNHE